MLEMNRRDPVLPDGCQKSGDVPKSPFTNRQPLLSVSKQSKVNGTQRGSRSHRLLEKYVHARAGRAVFLRAVSGVLMSW
jgi:hypothetical protein